MKTKAVISQVIADNIRQFRTRLRMRSVDLAKRTGLSKSHISRYESGERLPSVMSLLRIAYGLEVPVVYLLKGVT